MLLKRYALSFLYLSLSLSLFICSLLPYFHLVSIYSMAFACTIHLPYDMFNVSGDVERLINDNAIRLSLSLFLLSIVRYY